MTDKELLELAAKASGVRWIDEIFDYDEFGRMMVDFGSGVTEWNPLADDADAFRLAVKLNMVVDCNNWCAKSIRPETHEWVDVGRDDPYAATRRAIVRAAAEIGMGMP